MLVSMGENDDTTVNYGFAKNIGDGRGYTVGKVGFCTGTGDFIIVAACYNDLKPGNVLSKYWGHRRRLWDGGRRAHLLQRASTSRPGQNQGATTLIDNLGKFVAGRRDGGGRSPTGLFRTCQDAMADADYLVRRGPARRRAGAEGAAHDWLPLRYGAELRGR